jgi:hypothetical protein
MALINTTTTGVLGSTFFGDGTGALNVQQNGVTLGIYGNIPAFKVGRSSNQSFTLNTWTKIQFNSEAFDTNNNYDNVTNYRFQPTIAGYYQLQAYTLIQGTGITFVAMEIYKNGTNTNVSLGEYGSIASQSSWGTRVSGLDFANGTTDYYEVFAYATATSPYFTSPIYATNFSGFLVKAV